MCEEASYACTKLEAAELQPESLVRPRCFLVEGEERRRCWSRSTGKKGGVSRLWQPEASQVCTSDESDFAGNQGCTTS